MNESKKIGLAIFMAGLTVFVGLYFDFAKFILEFISPVSLGRLTFEDIYLIQREYGMIGSAALALVGGLIMVFDGKQETKNTLK